MGRRGPKGETVHAAPVQPGQPHEDQPSHLTSCPMAGAARLYVKQRGAQLCEQTSLIRLWQSLPKVIRRWNFLTSLSILSPQLPLNFSSSKPSPGGAEAACRFPLLVPLVIQRCPKRWLTMSPGCEHTWLSPTQPASGEQFFSHFASSGSSCDLCGWHLLARSTLTWDSASSAGAGWSLLCPLIKQQLLAGCLVSSWLVYPAR